MSSLLYLQASPRGERSRSIQVAEAFLETYRKDHADTRVTTVNLFEKDLPPFDGAALEAKYAILHQQNQTAQQQAAWSVVESVIEEFKRADRYVLAVPMWNFGIPYRLKQYFDVIVQPGYTFSYDPEKGYTGLVTGRKVFVAFARGGDYSEADEAAVDHQKSYLQLILGFMGLTDVQSVVVQPTLAGADDVKRRRLDEAIREARALAQTF